MTYLDHAATTPMSPAVITEMTRVMAETFGNPSSIHAYGRQATGLLRRCRSDIASCLQTTPDQIIFTSGGSESNNLAIKGYALANQDKGKHLITTAIEHHSVLHVMAYLEKELGFEVTYLTPENGHISASQVAAALRDDTILVSIMYANNETGAILPIKEIGDLLTLHPAVFHVDAVQAIGKLPIAPEELGIDFLSATAHKFHGPKGVGFLYAKKQYLTPQIHGGEQESKRRAGTENLPAIAGMALALKDSLTHQAENWEKLLILRSKFLEALGPMPYYLNTSEPTLPHIIPLGIKGSHNATLLTQLDLAGFAVSAGSACTAGTVLPSHVLSAYYGKTSERLREALRISLSDQTTTDELLELANTLHHLIGG